MTTNGFDADTLLTEAQMTRVMSAGYTAMGVYFTKSAIYAGMPAFIALCRKHGFRMWLIDEGTGSAAVFARGAVGGEQDGLRASAMARELEVPAGMPIYFAIDYAAGEADVANISDYYAGYKKGLFSFRAGMYADGLIASQVQTDVGDYVPGASGWPGTAEYLKSGKVALIQHPPVPFFGMDADPVEVVDESVLWAPSGATVVAPAPLMLTPAQPTETVFKPGPIVAVPESPLGPLVTVQQYLGITADGIYGPETAAAIQNHYLAGAGA